ncbi:MAG: hypothetical protein BGO49_20305 [Planctomycetales bacterium 71-10]|nr:MAG: hypothetical protein BGO49_20305 [Planctomycetales bacterium 71-10]
MAAGETPEHKSQAMDLTGNRPRRLGIDGFNRPDSGVPTHPLAAVLIPDNGEETVRHPLPAETIESSPS